MRDLGLQLLHLSIRNRTQATIGLDLLCDRFATLEIGLWVARRRRDRRQRVTRCGRAIVFASKLLTHDATQALFIEARRGAG